MYRLTNLGRAAHVIYDRRKRPVLVEPGKFKDDVDILPEVARKIALQYGPLKVSDSGQEFVPDEAIEFPPMVPAREERPAPPLKRPPQPDSIAPGTQEHPRAGDLPEGEPIPDNWRDLPWPDKRRLALKFSDSVKRREDAEAAIEAELAKRS